MGFVRGRNELADRGQKLIRARAVVRARARQSVAPAKKRHCCSGGAKTFHGVVSEGSLRGCGGRFCRVHLHRLTSGQRSGAGDRPQRWWNKRAATTPGSWRSQEHLQRKPTSSGGSASRRRGKGRQCERIEQVLRSGRALAQRSRGMRRGRSGQRSPACHSPLQLGSAPARGCAYRGDAVSALESRNRVSSRMRGLGAARDARRGTRRARRALVLCRRPGRAQGALLAPPIAGRPGGGLAATSAGPLPARAASFVSHGSAP